jgi:hypothetical protein
MSHAARRTATAVSALTLALTLGGCQMLGIGGSRMASVPQATERAEPMDFGAEQIAEGRKALTDGHIPQAIDSFMLAKSFQAHAPAAYNGLAVAYSRLGREDLAERFFLTAVALAPDDERFRTNLALFYVRSGIPRQTAPAMALAPAQPDVAAAPAQVAVAAAPAVLRAAPVVRSLGGGVTVQAPASRLQRVSAGEVTIRGSAAAAPGAVAANGHRAVIEVGGGRSGAAPARVMVASARPGATAQRTYPIRIPLAD